MWLTKENFLEFSNDARSQGQQVEITSMLNNYRRCISKWNRQNFENFGNIQKELSSIRDRLAQIQSGDYSNEARLEEQDLVKKYNETLHNEEIY